MNHIEYWTFIPGKNPPFSEFDNVAATAKQDDIIVEVGPYMGRGTCYMMESLKKFSSKARFYAIDTWGQNVEPVHGEGRTGNTPWGEQLTEWYSRMGGPGCFFDLFQIYVKHSPAAGYLHDYAQFPSACGCEFKNESVSYLHLGLSQKPENVKRDLDSWWPALKPRAVVTIYAPEAYETVCAFVDRDKVTEIEFGTWRIAK
jgi:hypothetical protein